MGWLGSPVAGDKGRPRGIAATSPKKSLRARHQFCRDGRQRAGGLLIPPHRWPGSLSPLGFHATHLSFARGANLYFAAHWAQVQARTDLARSRSVPRAAGAVFGAGYGDWHWCAKCRRHSLASAVLTCACGRGSRSETPAPNGARGGFGRQGEEGESISLGRKTPVTVGGCPQRDGRRRVAVR
jgi:hypothetical protein